MASSSAHQLDDKDSTKAGLKAWWSSFTKGKEKKDQRVFGEPLRKSLKYASVAISMAGEDGQQYVWGYVPVIVAKVGLYLKENATEVEGVFRIAGSQKRMRELQEIFDTPPKYGKTVDWSKYSVHDAASVLRRYLNQMPEPIVPLHLYSEFRNVMVKKPLDVESAIKTYRLLISSSPPANQYLLLYVLDLLAVFARKSDVNLMTASNLAVIFQPGMFSHPSHLTSAEEHKIAVEVLEFLLTQQDHFLLGMSPPPPANVPPAELTAVSQPPPPPDEVRGNDLMVPSDSDEDVGELEVHEGGGARIARSATAHPNKPSPRRKAGLFGLKKEAGSGNKLEDAAAASVEGGIARALPGEAPKEDISGPANAPVALRRNKTTPTRKGGAGAGSAASTPTSPRSSGKPSASKKSPGGGVASRLGRDSPATVDGGSPSPASRVGRSAAAGGAKGKAKAVGNEADAEDEGAGPALLIPGPVVMEKSASSPGAVTPVTPTAPALASTTTTTGASKGGDDRDKLAG